MRRTLDDYLTDLNKSILKMGSIVEEAIRDSTTALKEDNRDLARKVIRNDAEVNEIEIIIDKQCLEIFALFQPVAQDLRYVVSALKINNDLERIGDMAVNIAQSVLDNTLLPTLIPRVDIARMIELSRRMLHDSLGSYINRDSVLAHQVLPLDDEVDAIYAQIIRILITYMAEKPQIISDALDLIMIARNLERISDLSTNICEDVIFMVEGKVIKHHNVD